MKKSLKSKSHYVKFLLFILFNSFDCFLTYYFVKFMNFEEANPLMDWLLKQEPVGFVFYKIILVNFLYWNVCKDEESYLKYKLIIDFILFLYSALFIYWVFILVKVLFM